MRKKNVFWGLLSRTALLLAFSLLLAGCGSDGTEPGEKRQPLPTAGLTVAVTETPTPTAAPTPTATPEPTPWLAYPKPEYALVKETTVSYEGNEEALLGTAEVIATYTEDGYPLSFQNDTRTEEWSYETLEGSGEKRLLRYKKQRLMSGSGARRKRGNIPTMRRGVWPPLRFRASTAEPKTKSARTPMNGATATVRTEPGGKFLLLNLKN